MITRLRECREPILLFGETDEQSYKRLRKIELLAPELNKVSLWLHNMMTRVMCLMTRVMCILCVYVICHV